MALGPRTVLVFAVTADQHRRRMLKSAFKSRRYPCVTVDSAEIGMRLLRQATPTLVVLDYESSSEPELASLISKLPDHVPVIFLGRKPSFSADPGALVLNDVTTEAELIAQVDDAFAVLTRAA